ncbi:glycosyltransferase [Agromyces archimandritae]|uniref:D-inositol 3-phosphate glycosyltransferase n=1 Tax=Agromyces archimandritae TaxID=2781962 RepID=A0A975FQM8_9MICO|nr:glycosyltransferase [Agromyces archimandritae]QTX05431.1 glycosyltransferase [Agromyces archimandritae]
MNPPASGSAHASLRRLGGRTIVITQPYVPAYRVPLFDLLAHRLSEVGGRLEVHAGAPDGDQGLRADAGHGPWLRELHVSRIPLPGTRVEWRRFDGGAPTGLLVTELSASNLIAWANVSRRPVVLWGHGRNYVNSPSALADRLRKRLVSRAAHVMTYTEGGRGRLIADGADPGRVTTVGNSTDTAALTRAQRAITAARLHELATEFPGDPIMLFVGGLDASKRIGFIAAAAEAAHREVSGFHLIVAGFGAQADLLEPGIRDGYISRVGEARGMRLAELAALSRAVWMPGRVGLAAVDAMALGLPVHTIRHDRHAPEIELLGSTDVAFLPDDPTAFAEASLALAPGTPVGPRTPSPSTPSLEDVTDAMLTVFASISPEGLR